MAVSPPVRDGAKTGPLQRGTNMRSQRRDLLKMDATGCASFGALASKTAAAEEAQRKRAPRGAAELNKLNSLAFDGYGALVDVHSVLSLREQPFRGQGTAPSNTGR